MKSITLTPQEAQLVAHVLTDVAGMYQDSREMCKEEIDYFWKLSDKETESGKLAFRVLNKYKDTNRKLKAKEMKVNNLIRKIRKGL